MSRIPGVRLECRTLLKVGQPIRIVGLWLREIEAVVVGYVGPFTGRNDDVIQYRTEDGLVHEASRHYVRRVARRPHDKLFTIRYRHQGMIYGTVGQGRTRAAAVAEFKRQHPHVQVVRCFA